MTDPIISIKFEGGDADQHTVDMRLLGQSLQGFDRIISDGIILLSEGRLPKKRERAFLRVKAYAPKEGSHEITAIIQDGPGYLTLGWQLLSASEGKIIWHWISFVIKYFGGRKSDAKEHLSAMLELNKQQLDARAVSDKQHLDARAASDDAWRNMVMTLVDRLGPAAAQAAAPVGPSVTDAGVKVGSSDETVIDEAMADAIRAKGEVDVSDLQVMTLVTDGFFHHGRTLRVEHPLEPGRYFNASVKDPLFDLIPNKYTEAASMGASIVVRAKAAYRAGQLERLYIMDFVSLGPVSA